MPSSLGFFHLYDIAKSQLLLIWLTSLLEIIHCINIMNLIFLLHLKPLIVS